MSLRLIFILLFTFISFYSFSTAYYFSESLGNDSWSGRLAAPNATRSDGPKKSLQALNTLLNTVARPGDSILLKRGDKWSGNTGIIANSAVGIPGNHILIGSYDAGARPIIEKNGTGEILLCRGSANAASSYLTFQDLHLTTSSAISNRPVGVFINESFYSLKPHHITLNNLHIQSCQSGMILYQNNIIVENCLLEKNGNMNTGHGIFSSANDVIFRKNVLDSNGCGSFFVHTMYISQCNNVLFEDNIIRNADDGLKLRASTNLVIRNNTVHDMYIHTIHVGGDVNSGTKNVIIEGNLIYNAPQGITINSESGTQTLPSENIIIRNNILPAHLFISNNGPVKDIFIYNNLIHSTSNQNSLITLIAENPINIHLKNNIFYKTTANSNHSLVSALANSGLSGIVMENNLYYFPVASRNIIRVGSFTYTNLPAFQIAYPGQERFGQHGNPNFAGAPNNFNLTELSTLAIDKGANLTGLVDQDIDGRSRPIDGDGMHGALWDIGPYEYCCIIVATENTETKNKINIYPNPFTSEIIISSLDEIPEKIIIIDSKGKIIMESKTNSNNNNINLDHLQHGIYFVRIHFNSTVQIFKIVKQ